MQPVIIMMMPPGYPNQQFHHPIAAHYNPAPTVPFQYHHMPIHNECHQQRRKVFFAIAKLVKFFHLCY